MTRDWNLIRAALLELEKPAAAAQGVDPAQLAGLAGRDGEAVAYHVDLMAEAGFVTVKDCSTLRARRVLVSLSWKGHELLNLIRRDDVWTAVRQVGDVPFELLVELAARELRARVGNVSSTGGEQL